MSNDGKNIKPKPASIDSTPSVATSPQDKINKKILALRLKKEEESEARKIRVQDKEKNQKNKHSSIDTQIKRISIKLPDTIGNWKVPFSENALTPQQSQKKSSKSATTVKQPDEKLENKQDDKPQVGKSEVKKVKPQIEKSEVKPQIEKSEIKQKTVKRVPAKVNIKPPVKIDNEIAQFKDNDKEEVEEDESTSNILLLSKPGSRSIVKKSISFLDEIPSMHMKLNDKLSSKSNLATYFSPLPSSVPDNNGQQNGQTEREVPLNTNPRMINFPGYPDPYRHSDRPLAITRGNLQRHIDHQRLISDNKKAKHKVNESLINVLKSGKDEAIHVTIIPADEAKVLQIELKHWKFHRIAFLLLFGVAMMMGTSIVTLTMFSSINYFVVKAAAFEEEIREVNLEFCLHTDTMIIGSVFINAIGILIFRLFPHVKKSTVVKIHVFIFTFTCLLFMYSFIVAIIYHEKVTGREQHFYTLHAMVGLIIASFLLIDIVTGIYIIFRPSRSSVMYHTAIGMTTFMLSGACCVSGYLGRSLLFESMKIQRIDKKSIINNATGVLIILFCCLVRHIGADFRFRRRARPEWDTVFSRSLTSLEDYNIDREGCTLQEYVRRNIVPKK